jgi:hypothetical protein
VSWALRSERDQTLMAEVHRTCQLKREYKKAADDLVRLRATMDGYKYQYKHSLRQVARADGYKQIRRLIESTLILENGRAGGLTASKILDSK